MDSKTNAFNNTRALSFNPLILIISWERIEFFHLMEVRMPQGLVIGSGMERMWPLGRRESTLGVAVHCSIFNEFHTFSSHQNSIISIWVVNVF